MPQYQIKLLYPFYHLPPSRRKLADKKNFMLNSINEKKWKGNNHLVFWLLIYVCYLGETSCSGGGGKVKCQEGFYTRLDVKKQTEESENITNSSSINRLSPTIHPQPSIRPKCPVQTQTASNQKIHAQAFISFQLLYVFVMIRRFFRDEKNSGYL